MDVDHQYRHRPLPKTVGRYYRILTLWRGSGTAPPIFLDDLNDLTAWMTTPTLVVRDGSIASNSQVPPINQWVDFMVERDELTRFESSIDHLFG